LRTGRELYGEKRPILTRLGQMGNNICGKGRVNQYQIAQQIWRRRHDGMGLDGL